MRLACISLVGLVVAGCQQSTTTPSYSGANSTRSERTFVSHRIQYEIPSGFSIREGRDGEVVIVSDGNKNFGISHLRPKVPKDASHTSMEIVQMLIPTLKRDLIREGKKSLQPSSEQFGPNSFVGFSYDDLLARQTLDGYLVVGKRVLDMRIYLPQQNPNSKDQQTTEALRHVLSTMRDN